MRGCRASDAVAQLEEKRAELRMLKMELKDVQNLIAKKEADAVRRRPAATANARGVSQCLTNGRLNRSVLRMRVRGEAGRGRGRSSCIDGHSDSGESREEGANQLICTLHTHWT